MIHPLIEAYFDNGLAVYAGHPRERRPYAPLWNDKKTIRFRDREHYLEVLGIEPRINVSLKGNESGLVQIDPDSPSAMRWAIEHGLDNTGAWVIKSARGLKTLYKVPPDQQLPSSYKDDRPVEEKTIPDMLNELCLAPPSVHPSGLILEFARGYSPIDIPYSELAVLPQSLLDAWIELQPIKIKTPYRGGYSGGLTVIFDAIVAKIEPTSRLKFKSDGSVFGRCPFPENHRHGDKNPSFGVHPEKGWQCFSGCGKGKITELAVRLGVTDFGWGD